MVSPAEHKEDTMETATPALPEEMRELLGIVAFVLVMLAFIAAIFGINYVGSHLSTIFGTHCWQVQSAGAKTYEVNTCTGKTRPVPTPAMDAPPGKTP